MDWGVYRAALGSVEHEEEGDDGGDDRDKGHLEDVVALGLDVGLLQVGTGQVELAELDVRGAATEELPRCRVVPFLGSLPFLALRCCGVSKGIP